MGRVYFFQIISLFCAMLLSLPAIAQNNGPWQSRSDQGFEHYSARDGANRISINCDISASGNNSRTSISVLLGGRTPTPESLVGFNVDGTDIWLPTDASGEVMAGGCPGCRYKFVELWQLVRAGSLLEVIGPDDNRARFRLSGTARLMPKIACLSGPESGSQNKRIAKNPDRNIKNPWSSKDISVVNSRAQIDFSNPQNCTLLEPDEKFLNSVGADKRSERVALVVGMANYQGNIPPLRNPVRDVQQISETLLLLGFKIYSVVDTGDQVLAECADRMNRENPEREVTMFYYAGHGIQINDENYVIATNASASATDRTGFVSLNNLVSTLKPVHGSLLIFLDACRNNPFTGNEREGLSPSTGRELTVASGNLQNNEDPSTQARGVFISYSTSPNTVATDGLGDLSPYASAFAKHLAQPGQSVQRAMAAVANAVGEATDWAQTPWIRSSLTGELLLAGPMTRKEAKSASDNWAGRSKALLESGDRLKAVVAAMKGIPANVGDGKARKDFSLAYSALENAYLSTKYPNKGEFSTIPVRLRHGVWISPDRKTYSAAYGDAAGSTVNFQLYDMVFSRKIATLFDSITSDNFLTSITYNRSGHTLLAGYDNGLNIWNTRDGSRKALIPGINIHGFSHTLAPNSRRLLNEPLYDRDSVNVVDLSNGKTLTIKPSDFSRRNGEFSRFIKSNGGAEKISIKANFINDDQLCVVLASELTSRNSLRLAMGYYYIPNQSLDSFGQMEIINAHWIDRVFCSPNGRYVVVAASEEASEPVLRIFDFERDKKAWVIDGHGISFDPSSQFAAINRGQSISIHDADSGITLTEKLGDESAVTYHTEHFRAPHFVWNLIPVGASLLDKVNAMLGDEERKDIARERVSFWRIGSVE